MTISVRDLRVNEAAALGELLVNVYASLPGFPSPAEQPAYYEMLTHIGRFSERPATRVLVALDEQDALLGGVVYFADMAQYGSGGSACEEKNASGIRLLGVSQNARGRGVGKALTQFCIALARAQQHRHVVLHTTKAMQTAWSMYEKLGFVRAKELDFLQQKLPVFGFRLSL